MDYREELFRSLLLQLDASGRFRVLTVAVRPGQPGILGVHALLHHSGFRMTAA